jgi:hypothetical protein
MVRWRPPRPCRWPHSSVPMTCFRSSGTIVSRSQVSVLLRVSLAELCAQLPSAQVRGKKFAASSTAPATSAATG